MALPEFARRFCSAPAVQQSIGISCLPGPQQQTCSSGFAAVGPWWDRQTDGQADTVPLHRPCSAYYAGSANKQSSGSNNRSSQLFSQQFTKMSGVIKLVEFRLQQEIFRDVRPWQFFVFACEQLRWSVVSRAQSTCRRTISREIFANAERREFGGWSCRSDDDLVHGCDRRIITRPQTSRPTWSPDMSTGAPVCRCVVAARCRVDRQHAGVTGKTNQKLLTNCLRPI